MSKQLPGIDPAFWDFTYPGTVGGTGHGANSHGVGELSLLAGVVYGAIQDLHSDDIHKRKWAVWWLTSNSSSYPHFSFLDCCQHLNIDPASFRAKLHHVGAIIDDGDTRPTWRTPAGRKNTYPTSKVKGLA